MRQLVHVSSDLTRLLYVKINHFFYFNPCIPSETKSENLLRPTQKFYLLFKKKSQLMINNEYVIGIKFLNKSKSNQVR